MPDLKPHLFPLITKFTTGHAIPLTFMNADLFNASPYSNSTTLFSGAQGSVFILYAKNDAEQAITGLIIGCQNPDALTYHDAAAARSAIKARFHADFLAQHHFVINDAPRSYTAAEWQNIALGWALDQYGYDLKTNKTEKTANPYLLITDQSLYHRTESIFHGLCLTRDLINMPPNILGTKALADYAAKIANSFDATCTIIEDTHQLQNEFPLVWAVGCGSDQAPYVVDFTWGNPDHPAVTLVGKGVCFDTGGLDIKPPSAMALMKKDMGGAAHVLGLASIIMHLNLPIALRVIVPIVENAVSGGAFRPSDVIKSRKGYTVEIGDTDAEGRLILADCLTLACEEDQKPKLLIDFATLTGAARVATGFEIAPIFSQNDALAHDVQILAMQIKDPLWHMPLWQDYFKDMDSPIADFSNIGTGRAGAIEAALFLYQFIDPAIDWLHLDVYGWEQKGKAGRPRGGADCGVLAILQYLEQIWLPSHSQAS
jgi:leucyl aminopeptidase